MGAVSCPAAVFPKYFGLIGMENKAREARTLAYTLVHIDPEANTHHQMKYIISWLPESRHYLFFFLKAALYCDQQSGR